MLNQKSERGDWKVLKGREECRGSEKGVFLVVIWENELGKRIVWEIIFTSGHKLCSACYEVMLLT